MEGLQIMKLFLDTNILIDYYGRRQPFFSDASKLFVAQAFGDVELWASAKSFTDVFYVIGRQVGESRLQSMFASSFKYLRVCGVDGADLSDAATRSWSDFEDCLVSIAAEKTKADYLVTRDVAGFSHSSVPAISPQDFLLVMRDRYHAEYDDLASELSVVAR